MHLVTRSYGAELDAAFAALLDLPGFGPLDRPPGSVRADSCKAQVYWLTNTVDGCISTTMQFLLRLLQLLVGVVTLIFTLRG